MQQRLLAVMVTLSVALTLTAAAVQAAKLHHYPIPHYASWLRIAQCETGSRWNWNSGTYQGGLGFYYGTWDAFRPRWFPAEAYWASPNQQMYVAERVWARYGFGAWGCGIYA